MESLTAREIARPTAPSEVMMEVVGMPSLSRTEIASRTNRAILVTDRITVWSSGSILVFLRNLAMKPSRNLISNQPTTPTSAAFTTVSSRLESQV